MLVRISRISFALILSVSMTLVGCGGGSDQEPADADTTSAVQNDMPAQQSATAQLSPTEGNNVMGTVTFTSVNGAVRVEADVQHLTPGMHGFHIHETGDCSAPDAGSAGGHFAPQGRSHGGPTDAERHAGDLGNLEAGADSTAMYSRVDSVLTLQGPNSIVGKAVIVHSGEDDLTTQPTGNAGDRLACGVIQHR